MKRILVAIALVLLMVSTALAGETYIIPKNQIQKEQLVLKVYENINLALVSSNTPPKHGVLSYGTMPLMLEETIGTPVGPYVKYKNWSHKGVEKFNEFYTEHPSLYVPVVAIMDTGCGPHVHLNDEVLWEYAYNAVTHTGDVEDTCGHGTAVAGAIAGELSGITKQVKLIPVKITGDGGASWSSVMEAFDYLCFINPLIEFPHKLVINFSFSLDSWWPIPGVREVWDIVFEALKENDILLINASGNSHLNLDAVFAYPACLYNWNLVAVAATNPDNTLANFSNFGKYQVETSAPGVLIYTTLPKNLYKFMHGTSFSAPYVAGIAASYWCLVPSKKAVFIKGDLTRCTTIMGFPVTSRGILNPDKLIEEVLRYNRTLM